MIRLLRSVMIVTRQRLAGMLLVLLLGAASRGNEPQTTQPAPPGKPPPNLFSLRRLDAATELTAEWEQRRVRTDTQRRFDKTSQTNRRQTFDEQLILDLDGSVFDPDLLSLAGTLGLGLTQERFHEKYQGLDKTDTNEGLLSTYDLRGEFLRGRKLSGTAYGLRTQDRVSRPFLPSLREERNDYGAALYWTDDQLPMQLTFDHRSADRTGNRRQFDDENLTEDRFHAQATWITSAAHSLKLSYEYEETEERFSGSHYTFHNTRNELRLDDELLFGPQNQHRLDSIIRYQDESGSYARDLLEIGPRLSLHHSDTLSTYYQYQFAREEVGQVGVETHRGDWQLVHQLYQNLTTTLNVFGLEERVDNDSETNEWGATADWSYTRGNPLGHFSADLSLSTESERTQGGGVRVVVAESGCFCDPLPIALTRTDVLPWSIVVRDTKRQRIYLPGLDYFLSWVRGRTLLVRNPLGAIPSGTSVSIDYVYRIDRDASRDSQIIHYSMQQDFDGGWTPYYVLDFRHDDRDWPAGYFRVKDDDSNRHRLGLRYRGERLTGGAELEILRDEIDPFVSYRFYATKNLLKQGGKTLDARADLARYFFDNHDRGDATVLEFSFDGRADLTRNSDAYFRSTYRFENDPTRGRGVLHGVDVEAGLTRRWGLFTFVASIEYDLLRIVDSNEDGVTVWLKVRRDLPNLLGGKP